VGAAHPVDSPLACGTACPAAAGDVLFFNYLTIHGSGVNRSSRTRRNVLFQYRDPADAPVFNGDGVEDHVDWGMGLMVAGGNPGFWAWRPRFGIRQHELVNASGVSQG
jgi:ectoine hydroxylase-related dioxygenase (phytanoyl-CoA dioxygenase family)